MKTKAPAYATKSTLDLSNTMISLYVDRYLEIQRVLAEIDAQCKQREQAVRDFCAMVVNATNKWASPTTEAPSQGDWRAPAGSFYLAG